MVAPQLRSSCSTLQFFKVCSDMLKASGPEKIKDISEMLANTIDSTDIADEFQDDFKIEVKEFNELVKGCQTMYNITRTDALAVKFHSNSR